MAAKRSSNLTVTKANELVEATYRLTLNEQRLILLCIAQLDSRKPAPRTSLTVNAADFAEQFGLRIEHAYEALSDATTALYERDIRRINGGSRGATRQRIRWVYTVKYHDGEGRVTLGFSPEILPYLTLLHKRFTSYNLQRVSSLRSVYSIRLYEMLCQFQSIGRLVLSVEEFRERLDLGERYQRFTHLKSRVIVPAVTELQTKSNFRVEWTAEKQGRRVVRLRFEFEEQAQKTLPLE